VRLAVDLVILPDPALTAWAIAANRTLTDRRLPLGDGGGLPHVSLSMGTIEDHEIDRVADALDALDAPELVPTAIDTASGVAVLRIERTPLLVALHEAVMGIELSREVDATMLVGPPDERAVSWIRTYPEKAAFERFDPHVTLGVGVPDAAPFAPRYPPGRLALCHLGPFCTCRRVLR
jgi:hypothetical protein